jgi:hypothetical protein
MTIRGPGGCLDAVTSPGTRVCLMLGSAPVVERRMRGIRVSRDADPSDVLAG